MAVGGGQGFTSGKIQCPTCRATLPSSTVVCPICSTNLRTAAPSAATHTQVAAVSIPPTPGPATQPVPAGGFQPIHAPAPSDVVWDEPGLAAPAAPPATMPPPPPPQGMPAAPPTAAPAAVPASSVEALLAQATAPEPPARGPGRPSPISGKPARTKAREGLAGEELREFTMRRGILLTVVVAIAGWAVTLTMWTTGKSAELWKTINPAGVVALAVSLYMLLMASRAASKTREKVGATEASKLSNVRLGGFALWLVPIIGAFLAEPLGLVYQSQTMHPVYYLIIGAAVLLMIIGLSGMKERGTYFALYQFGALSVVLSTLPMALPSVGDLMASGFWWSSTFIMIGIGYVFMAFVVRQMRQGQYSQLDEVISSADRAFAARRFDEAMRLYSQGITLTHTLYSDAVFAVRNPRVRSPVHSASVPEEYFRPWIGKAKCLALSGKLRKALAIYDLMLEVDPDLPQVWVDRGRILLAEKRYAEAYISFDRAVKLDPASEEARRNLSETLEVIRRIHA